MPVSVREAIAQELEHLHHHRTNVEEKSLLLELAAVKKIANNNEYIGTNKTHQKLEAIKEVGDEMVIVQFHQTKKANDGRG